MIYKKQNNCKGFSIIEILLCAALGLLLFEAVLQSYLNAKYLYQVQNDLAQINENIRFADFVLWQTIMQSGYAGCRKLSKLDLYELNGRCFGVRGYESSSVPDHLKNKHIVSSTDVVVITKASVANVPIADDVFAGAISFKIEGNLEVIDDQVLLLSDCKNGDLVEVKSTDKNTVYVKTELRHGYKNKKAEVKGFKETAFFISDTRRVDKKNQPIYGLYSSINRGKKQELVSGVSEMKILYGVDIDGQGRVNKYLKASEVDDWDRVVIVMIGLKFQGLRLTKQKNIYIRLRGDG